MSRADTAHDAAAMWIIRRENGAWSDADKVEFDRWLSASDGNRAAYWRLKHSWSEADRVGSLGIRAAPREMRRVPARVWGLGAIAASIALVIGITAFRFAEGWQMPQPVAVAYETHVGGHRIVPLADGSRVELNTRTMMRAAVTKSLRRVWLDKGEAFFSIAHDAAHPFVIYAGAKRVTVLGTKFSVRRDGDKVSVSVLEGRVRIDDAAAPDDDDASSAIVTGGVLALTDGPSTLVTQKSEERVQAELAWRDGMLKFDETPLSDAASEFNRYNQRRIVIADNDAAAIRIGGTFQTSNIDAFARLLHDAYGLRVTNTASEIKISTS